MKIKDLREKSEVELDRLLVECRNKLRDLRFRIAAKQLGNVREVRETRRTIAQILTLKKANKPVVAKQAETAAPAEPAKA